MATVKERIKEMKLEYENSIQFLLEKEDLSEDIKNLEDEYQTVSSKLSDAYKKLFEDNNANIELKYQEDLSDGGTMTRDEYFAFWENEHIKRLENDVKKLAEQKNNLAERLADNKTAQSLNEKYNGFKQATLDELMEEVLQDKEFFEFAEKNVSDEDKKRFCEILTIEDEAQFLEAIEREKELAASIAPLISDWTDIQNKLFNTIKETQKESYDIKKERKNTEREITKLERNAKKLEIEINNAQKEPTYEKIIRNTQYAVDKEKRNQYFLDLANAMQDGFNFDSVKSIFNKFNISQSTQEKLLPKPQYYINKYNKELDDCLNDIKKEYEKLTKLETNLNKIVLQNNTLAFMDANAKTQETQLASKFDLEEVIEPMSEQIHDEAENIKKEYNILSDYAKAVSHTIGEGIAHFGHGIGSWSEVHKLHGIEAHLRRKDERQAVIAFESYNKAQKRLIKAESKRDARDDKKINKALKKQKRFIKNEANRIVDEKVILKDGYTSRKERAKMLEAEKQALREKLSNEKRADLQKKRGRVVDNAKKAVEKHKKSIDEKMAIVANNKKNKIERINQDYEKLMTKAIDGKISEKQFLKLAKSIQIQYEEAHKTTFRSDLEDAMRLSDAYMHRKDKSGYTLTQLNDMSAKLQSKFDKGTISKEEFDSQLKTIMDEYKKSQVMGTYYTSLEQAESIDFEQRNAAVLKSRNLIADLNQITKMLDMERNDILLDVSNGKISKAAFDFYDARIGKESDRDIILEFQKYQEYAREYAANGFTLNDIINQENIAKENLNKGVITQEQFDATMKDLKDLKQGYMNIGDFSQNQLDEIDSFINDRDR